MKVLVTPVSLCKNKEAKPIKLLSQYADEIVFNPYGRPIKEEEFKSLLSGVDGIIAGLDYYTAGVISSFPESVKVISRYGIGYDRVDLKAAGEKGIAVTVTPGTNNESVADLTMGLILSVARKIPMLNNKVRSGEWAHLGGIELSGKTIGIVGLGAIGKAVAARAKGFSMRVLSYDPYMNEEYAKNNGIISTSLEELIKESDVITLHLPVNESTKNIISREAISKMKDGAILINSARGGLIDEEAVYEALKNNKLYGLGVDAFSVEPPVDNPLLKLDNVVATSHVGANTTEASEKMGMLAVKNLINVLKGAECPYIINKDFLE